MRPHRRTRLKKILILAVAVFVCYFIFSVIKHNYYRYIHPHPMSLKELKSNTCMQFPPNTKLEGGFFQPMGLDYSYYAKLTMPRQEADWFIQNGFSKYEVPPLNLEVGFELPDRLWGGPSTRELPGIAGEGWWNPEEIQDGLGTSFSFPDVNVSGIYILTDQKSPTTTIYIMVRVG